jgi:hypothetical protein
MMGPSDRTAAPREVPDNVTRMQAILDRHRHLTYLRPGQAGVAHHTVTWIDVDTEDAQGDGTPVTVSRMDLGMLCSYLEARLGL